MTQGTSSISQSGLVTSVQQDSQKATINWQGFSVGANETVNFLQPNASAVLLNRVVGNERSVIDGVMNANGQVFLVNSAGILFGRDSSVNVGGLVASTRPISDADFLAGRHVFGGSSTAGVLNQGHLTAAEGGYIALLGASVSNQGVITATKGTLALAAGDMITLNLSGNALLSVSVDQGTLDALVENQQAIYADGGTILLTAKAASGLLRSTVNVGGVVQAQTIDDLLGRVEVSSQGGTALVTGTIDVRAIGAGNGGFIETSGDTVKVADNAQILTRAAQGRNGKWLVDPNDYTIAASGGDITGAFLSTYLDTQGDYEVQSVAGASGGNGDIHVNDAISWGSDSKLTLTAQRDININNAIAVNGPGGQLALNFGGDYRIRTPASYAGAVLDANGKPVANTDTSGGVYGSVTFNDDANLHGLTINGNVYTPDLLCGRIAYSAPLGSQGLRGEVAASRTTYKLGDIYAPLGALGTARSFEANLSYAFHRSRMQNLTVMLNLVDRRLYDEVQTEGLATTKHARAATLGATLDRFGQLFSRDAALSATGSITWGHLRIDEPAMAAANQAGANTVGSYGRFNLNLAGRVALTDALSAHGALDVQRSIRRNLDSSEHLLISGTRGVTAYESSASGDDGYLVKAELRYALPALPQGTHAIGAFTNLGRVSLHDARFTTANGVRLSDVGIGYTLSWRAFYARLQAARAVGWTRSN